jgi:hypothetical protein
MSAGRSPPPFAVAVVAASRSVTQNIELADLRGLPVIKRICPAYLLLTVTVTVKAGHPEI